jgi:phosphoglycolate phosphatase|tara:strand:+ start:4346 stop:5056 length:711 start_codon:yes stop_codon:yes gene_type:complete
MPHAPHSQNRRTGPTDWRQRPVALFDLDGTLVDSAPDLAGALNLLLVELGRPPLGLDQIIAMVGNGAGKLVERGLRASRIDHDLSEATQRFMTLYGRNLVVQTRPYAGVVANLTALRDQGWRMAICTNKPQWASRQILGQLGLAGFFELVAGGDSYAVRKPDPGHLTQSLARMGATNAPAVLVGDGAPDLQSALAAGLPALWCRFGYINAEAQATARRAEVNSFEEITPALLASLL